MRAEGYEARSVAAVYEYEILLAVILLLRFVDHMSSCVMSLLSFRQKESEGSHDDRNDGDYERSDTPEPLLESCGVDKVPPYAVNPTKSDAKKCEYNYARIMITFRVWGVESGNVRGRRFDSGGRDEFKDGGEDDVCEADDDERYGEAYQEYND